MTKKEARAKYNRLRQMLTEPETDAKSLAVANQVLKLPVWTKSCFHIFLPIDGKREVNTEYLLHIIAGKDKNIVVSKSDFNNMTMQHFLLADNTRIEKNKFGIPEPVDGIEVPSQKIDVVFVPLLAYDKLGHRAGYGKGFYDRFLSECRSDVVKIGLSFFGPEASLDDVSENDVKLDFCVTPDTIWTF